MDFFSRLQTSITKNLQEQKFLALDKVAGERVNKQHSVFRPSSSHLILLDREAKLDETVAFYLTFMELGSKNVITLENNNFSIRRLPLIFQDEHNKEFKFNKVDCPELEMSLNPYQNQNLLLLYSQKSIYVSKINSVFKNTNNSRIIFKKVDTFQDLLVRTIKWHPIAEETIGVLTLNKKLLVYNFDDLNDSTLDIDVELDNDDEITDFSFSQVKYYYDFSAFSVFFLSARGNIYYICPLLLPKMVFEKHAFETLEYKLNIDKGNKLIEEGEFIKFLSIIDFMKKNVIEKRENLYLNFDPISSEAKIINKDYMQGPMKLLKKKRFGKEKKEHKKYVVLNKIENSLYHIFAIANKKGKIKILFTTFGIWPSSIYQNMDFLNKHQDLRLINTGVKVICVDKLLMARDLKKKAKLPEDLIKEEGIKNYLDFIKNTKPIFLQISHDIKSIFVLFFEKIYEINLEWLLKAEEKIENFNIYYNESFKTNFKLIFNNPHEKINEKDVTSLKNFRRFDWGYYTVTIFDGLLLVGRPKGAEFHVYIHPLSILEEIAGLDNENENTNLKDILNQKKSEVVEFESISKSRNWLELTGSPVMQFSNNEAENLKKLEQFLKAKKENLENMVNDFDSRVQNYEKKGIEVTQKCKFMMNEMEKYIERIDNLKDKQLDKITKENESIGKQIENICHIILSHKCLIKKDREYEEKLEKFEAESEKMKKGLEQVKEKLSRDKDNKETNIFVEESLKKQFKEILNKNKIIYEKLQQIQEKFEKSKIFQRNKELTQEKPSGKGKLIDFNRNDFESDEDSFEKEKDVF